MQNNKPSLLDGINANAVELNRSTWKIGLIGFVGLVSAYLLSFSFARLIINSGGYSLILIPASLFAFFTVFLLQALVVKGRRLNFTLVFLEFIFLILPIISELFKQSPFFIAAVLVLISAHLLWGNFSGLKNQNNSMKIHFFSFAKIVFSKVWAGLSILFVLTTVLVVDFKTFEFKSSWIDYALRPALPLVSAYLSGFHPKISIDDLLYRVADRELKKIENTAGVQEEGREFVIKKTVIDLRERASEIISLRLNGTERIDELLSSLLNKLLLDIRLSGSPHTLLLIAFVLFMLFKFLGIFINYFIALFAFLVYELLLVINFIEVPLEVRSKEVVVLK